jgi:predicted nucleic acid-binding protein
MIVLDTSVLVDALTGPRRSAPALRQAEWLRGPRQREELAAQEALMPREESIPFGLEEAEVAARLYSEIRKPRGREVDLAIAASALTHGARLWTLNAADFRDIPDLELYEPRA